jgi:uncharacterized protein YecT (DUF1311 family)
MKKPAFALSLLSVMSIATASDTVQRTKQYDRCIQKAGAVEAAIIACIGDEYRRQDKRLNVAYQALSAALKGDRKQQLLEAQRLWGKYTEAKQLPQRPGWRHIGAHVVCRVRSDSAYPARRGTGAPLAVLSRPSRSPRTA